MRVRVFAPEVHLALPDPELPREGKMRPSIISGTEHTDATSLPVNKWPPADFLRRTASPVPQARSTRPSHDLTFIKLPVLLRYCDAGDTLLNAPHVLFLNAGGPAVCDLFADAV